MQLAPPPTEDELRRALEQAEGVQRVTLDM